MRVLIGFVLIMLVILASGCTQTENQIEPDVPQDPEDTGAQDSGTTDPETGEGEAGEVVEEEPEEEEDSSLIAYWNFDETTGSVASDSAGGFDGVVHGGEWKSGKVGNALYFDGMDDYVDLETAMTTVGGLSEGTIAFWFNYESMLDTQTIMPILHLGTDSTDDSDNIYIIEIGHTSGNGQGSDPDPNNKKLYSTWTVNNMEPVLCFDSKHNVEEGEWHHFAVVVGPDGNTGYLDGAELTDRYYNFGTASDKKFMDAIPVQEQFTLGYGKTHYMISPEFLYYKGYIDELRIYSRALSLSEIQELA